LKITDKILPVDAAAPQRDVIARAVAVLQSGGMLVFPTQGLYGLGVAALNAPAVESIFNLKGRNRAKPILVLIDTLRMLASVAEPPSALIRSLMTHFWPGGVTFVVHARAGLPVVLTGGGAKIGVRQVAHPVARAIVQAMQTPITGTSANLSGSDGCALVADIDPAVIDRVDLVLDAGRLTGGTGSTVVDCTAEKPVILRAGAVPVDEIMDVWHRLAKGRAGE
jgi:L-threonylcarbamoyladenylate synthase